MLGTCSDSKCSFFGVSPPVHTNQRYAEQNRTVQNIIKQKTKAGYADTCGGRRGGGGMGRGNACRQRKKDS